MSSGESILHSDQRWDVLPDFAPLLANILASPGENVKRSALRSVTRHPIGDRTFYVKNYFHHAQIFAPLKYFFKSAASRSEWELAPRLQQLGISVVPHLAHGECWNWRGLQKSTLITEGPSGFAPLHPGSSSASVQAALGKFIRQLHECSVFHDDLHISNLLYSPVKNEFCLVDLDNIKIFPSLDLEQRLDNLATLNRRFPLEREFFDAYDGDFFRYKNKVARRTQAKMRESAPKKLKYLFQDQPAFAPKKIGNLNWHVRRISWNAPLESILKNPDEFLARRAQLLKDGTRSTVGCADGFVVKRFNFKKHSTVIFDLFRSSRGRRGFRTARHLELLKIATPRPIAFADNHRFGFVVQSYFVMEEVSGANYLWEKPGARHSLINRLAELIAKTHDEGFSHRDLKETNIIMDAANLPHLIDLDALHYVGKLSHHRAAVELARLAQGFARRVRILPKERLRFLKLYCDIRGIENWRWWWNEIGKNLPPTLFSK